DLWRLGPRRCAVDRDLRGQGQPEVRHAGIRQLGSEESGRSYANDSKRMSIDLVPSAYDRGIRAVLVLPCAIAQHRDWRRTLLIILVAEKAADPGLHAKGPEEIAGHKLAISCLCRRLGSRSAHAKSSVARLQRCQVGELWCVLAKIPVRLIGEQGKVAVATLGIAAPVAAAIFIPDPPQLARLGHRQRLQHHLVHQSKYGRGGSNSQSECYQGSGCKSRRLAQLP